MLSFRERQAYLLMLGALIELVVLDSLVGRSCYGRGMHADPGSGLDFGGSIIVEDMVGKEGA